jgi:hypothetical protein
VGFLKGFYTIFNPAVGVVRAKNSEKNRNTGRRFYDFERRGG